MQAKVRGAVNLNSRNKIKTSQCNNNKYYFLPNTNLGFFGMTLRLTLKYLFHAYLTEARVRGAVNLYGRNRIKTSQCNNSKYYFLPHTNLGFFRYDHEINAERFHAYLAEAKIRGTVNLYGRNKIKTSQCFICNMRFLCVNLQAANLVYAYG